MKKVALPQFKLKLAENKLPPKRERSHQAIIKAENVNKSFLIGERRVMILKDIDLTFYSGEFVIIFGPSGCGKSTFLHVMLGIEKPDSGKIFLRGKSIYHLDEDERAIYRREKIGMVFQKSDWIKSLTVLENVAYPLYLNNKDQKSAESRALEMLKIVGLDESAGKNPQELSGGEQQKVALARALVSDPGILVCDEPTGNLDSKSSTELMKVLMRLNREKRKAIIMVTHEGGFLPFATRRIFMQDGEVVKDEHD